MAVYTSVKLLNNDDEDSDINTKTGKQMRNLLYVVMHYVHIQAQTLHYSIVAVNTFTFKHHNYICIYRVSTDQ